MKPDRFPAGDRFNESEAVVVKNEILNRKESNPDTRKIYDDAYGLRPEFELHNMNSDPCGLVNLAEDPEYREIFDRLFKMLKKQLIKNEDPRLHGQGDIWESYPRFMGIRKFNGDHPAHRGVYNEYYIQPGQRIPQYLFDSKAITPNIDKLVSEGVYFTSSVSVSPVCAPHRASLFTGKYSSSTGMVVNELRMNPNHKAIAHVLNEGGYETGYIGKWHLWGDEAGGHHKDKNSFTPPGPGRLGFDGVWKSYGFHHNNYNSYYYEKKPEKIKRSGCSSFMHIGFIQPEWCI